MNTDLPPRPDDVDESQQTDDPPPAKSPYHDIDRLVAPEFRRHVWEHHVSLRSPPSWQDLLWFLESLVGESDRAVAVLCVAYIDTQIEKMLATEFNPRLPGGPASLLGPEKLFGTFAAKVNLCQAIRWITDNTAHDLHLLRKIRNAFAHNVDATLEDNKIKGYLSSHYGLKSVLDGAIETGAMVKEDDVWHFVAVDQGKPLLVEREPRLDLTLAVAYTVHQALRQLYILPSGWRSGTHAAVFLKPDDELPPAMMEYDKALTNLFYACVKTEAFRQALGDDELDIHLPREEHEDHDPVLEVPQADRQRHKYQRLLIAKFGPEDTD